MKNEKSTFSVLFYLKKDKMKKNGLVPIHARITINGKQTQFNTKLEVLWKIQCKMPPKTKKILPP